MASSGFGSSEKVIVTLRDEYGLIRKVSGKHVPLHLHLIVALYPLLRTIRRLMR